MPVLLPISYYGVLSTMMSIISKLNHTNVPRFHRVFILKGYPYSLYPMRLLLSILVVSAVIVILASYYFVIIPILFFWMLWGALRINIRK